MQIERYSHVMHIVSTVTSELAEGRTAYDLLAATFPAGTLSGAPSPVRWRSSTISKHRDAVCMAGSWVIWTSLETWTRRSQSELLSCAMELPTFQAGAVSSLTRMPKPNRLNANTRRRPCFAPSPLLRRWGSHHVNDQPSQGQASTTQHHHRKHRRGGRVYLATLLVIAAAGFVAIWVWVKRGFRVASMQVSASSRSPLLAIPCIRFRQPRRGLHWPLLSPLLLPRVSFGAVWA